MSGFSRPLKYLERSELGDVSVGEVLYEEKLVRVEERHVRWGTVGPVGIV